MTDLSKVPGLKSIDPIQGLVDYVLDIKPYHSKIFETLVEYIYTDYVNVTATEITQMGVDSAYDDDVNSTILESSITEFLDFFTTAPVPPAIVSTDTSTNSIIVSGNVAGQFATGTNVKVFNSTSNDGDYFVVSASYDSGLDQTTITLNSLDGSNGTDGTIIAVDTSYDFALTIASTIASNTVTDPANASNTFTTPAFVVPGNATRAIQAGSVFYAKDADGNNVGTFYAVYVLFVPHFDPTTGFYDKTLDTTIIGFGAPLDTSLPPTGVTLNPYIISGYDNKYDAPYDQMAGYHIVSS